MDSPDLRQLRYFLAVAEELHFGRAAQRLGMAQPPLTQQIQKLESLLGCRLFVRGRRTQLTAAGAVLKEDARRLLDQAELAFEHARRVNRGEAGQLRLGVPPSVMLTRLPSAIRRYRQRYPEIQFTLRELATSAIEDELRAGRLDLGLLRESHPAEPLRTRLYLKEAMIAVLPVRHRLLARRAIRLAELKQERFVLFPKHLGPELYDRIVHACVDAGFTPQIAQEATQWQTVVSLVEAGMGISLAPECVSRFKRPAVGFRAVAGRPETSVQFAWPGEEPAPAASQFMLLAASGVS